MAVNINRVYQKVLALANKEQRGYITPQEFNLFADKAQMEIYNNYFHGIKMAEQKPKNQMLYADEIEMIEEKLQPFLVDELVNVVPFVTSLSTPSPSSPMDISNLNIHKLTRITRGNGTVVTPINKSQIHNTEGNPLTKATLTRSVYIRQDMNQGTHLNIIPAVTAAPVNTLNTDTNNDGENDAEAFVVSFYKRPAIPNWTYVVVNGKALFNSTAADLQNFELHASEEEDLVSRILMSAGVILKQQDIYQAGATSIQLKKQQQNS
jgi:hypothetical protein